MTNTCYHLNDALPQCDMLRGVMFEEPNRLHTTGISRERADGAWAFVLSMTAPWFMNGPNGAELRAFEAERLDHEQIVEAYITGGKHDHF